MALPYGTKKITWSNLPGFGFLKLMHSSAAPCDRSPGPRSAQEAARPLAPCGGEPGEGALRVEGGPWVSNGTRLRGRGPGPPPPPWARPGPRIHAWTRRIPPGPVALEKAPGAFPQVLWNFVARARFGFFFSSHTKIAYFFLARLLLCWCVGVKHPCERPNFS